MAFHAFFVGLVSTYNLALLPLLLLPPQLFVPCAVLLAVFERSPLNAILYLFSYVAFKTMPPPKHGLVREAARVVGLAAIWFCLRYATLSAVVVAAPFAVIALTFALFTRSGVERAVVVSALGCVAGAIMAVLTTPQPTQHNHETVIAFKYAPAPPTTAAVLTAVKPGLNWEQCQQWQTYITRAARLHDVPEGIMYALLAVETACAPPDTLPVSEKGAVCGFQIMPRETGIAGRPSAPELTDPATCAEWAARILRDNFNVSRSIFTATRMYNGVGQVAEKYAATVVGAWVAAELNLFIEPVGQRGVGFGQPVWWQTGGWHKGVDYLTPVGTAVYAPADGEIVWNAGLNCTDDCEAIGYGLAVVLEVARVENERLFVVYGHLSRAREKGYVKRGDWIADTGASGFSTPPNLPHLHVEVAIAQSRPQSPFWSRKPLLPIEKR